MRQLRFTFHRLIFRGGAGIRGRQDVAIEIQVDGFHASNPYDNPIEVRSRATVDIDALGWTHELDVEGRTTPIEVRILARFDEPGNTATIGEITRSIAWPYHVRDFRDSVRGFIVEWELEQVDAPGAAAPAAGAFVCREDAAGGAMCSTVGGAAPTRIVVAMHDVIPVPRRERNPTRPRFPRGTARAFTDARAYTAAQLAAGAMNMIENPGVIPIMPAGTALDDTNCARFRVTYYKPQTYAFTDDDARLQWSVVSLSGGGQARFHGASTGTKVALHGVTRGVVGLECRFEGALVTTFRALVEPLVYLPCRFTLLYGSANPAHTALRSRFTPARIQGQLDMANRFLWQMGVQLRGDTDLTVGWLPAGVAAANVAPVAGQPGFFTAVVPAGWTRGFNSDVRRPSVVNSREWVVNFAYVRSDGGFLGMAQCFHTNGGNVTDDGTPSTSWITPSGVPPGPAARSQRMRIFATHPHPTLANRYALYVTNDNANDFEATGTVAHEFGHALGLMHRLEHAGLGNCGVQYPWSENLMHKDNPTTIAQDLDLIQGLAVRQSPLVAHWAAAPAPAAPAPAPAPAPAAPPP